MRTQTQRGSWFFLIRSPEPSDLQKAVQFNVTDGAVRQNGKERLVVYLRHLLREKTWLVAYS